MRLRLFDEQPDEQGADDMGSKKGLDAAEILKDAFTLNKLTEMQEIMAMMGVSAQEVQTMMQQIGKAE